MFQTKVVEQIKLHISCLVTFFENLAVHENVSKNMADTQRLQMAIWQRVACWFSKATEQVYP